MFSRLLSLIPLLILLGGCGQVITKPTPTPFSPAPTATPDRFTPAPSPTVTPTATPLPATPNPSPTPTPEPTPIIHTLQAGDTLIGLARRYGVTVQAIQEANGITDPRGLLAGQQIIIPLDPEARLGAGGEPTPEPTPPPIRIGPLAFSDQADGLWAFGQALLSEGEPLEHVVVQVDLLDADGAMVASVQAPLLQDMLLPREDAGFFVVRFTPRPPSFDRYQSRVVNANPAHTAFHHRELAVRHVLIQDAGESVYLLSGEVTNVGKDPTYETAVIVALLDEQGQVTGLRKVATTPPDIQPGETAFFSVELIPIHLPFADYRLLAEGHRNLTPDE